MKEIFTRSSIRQFQDKEVEKEKVLQILKAGMQAPSACNQQPWEFFVIENKETISKLSLVSPHSRCAKGAPVIIVPVYHKDNLTCPEYAQIDMAIAMENMWLETTSLDLGGVWLGIAPNIDRMKQVKEILNLDDNLEPFSLFPIGYKAIENKQTDRFDLKRIHFDN